MPALRPLQSELCQIETAPSAAPETVTNAAWEGATPTLSVLIRCYRHDPTRLIAALDAPGSAVEIVVLDDASDDERLAWAISAAVRTLRRPASFIRLSRNQGRARGRNRLAATGRAPYLLFLDSDMLPDDDDFLDRWLALVAREDPPVAFGGFTLAQASDAPLFAVHRALARRSDCLPAALRRRAPEKHLFTSNLLVRRDVFNAYPFDPAFNGWGWEDIEWAIRVSRNERIRHVDIPATHLGLDPAHVVAAKFEQSAANLARIAARHRDLVNHYPGDRAALALKGVPLMWLWRPWLKAAALIDAAPVAVRALALRLYRAALYAEALR